MTHLWLCVYSQTELSVWSRACPSRFFDRSIGQDSDVLPAILHRLQDYIVFSCTGERNAQYNYAYVPLWDTVL